MTGTIQSFYEGTTLLITGGTGFLGKLLIEKLLRACPGIKKIYLIIRPKNGEDPKTRCRNIFKTIIFNELLSKNPEVIKKVVCLEGDATLPNFGLNSEAQKLIENEVNIVFHNASLVDYDTCLKNCLKTNIGGTKTLITLAKSMKNLKIFNHISTVYSGFPHLELEELIHDVSGDVDYLIKVAEYSKHNVDELSEKILGEFPNSVVYTKAVAEKLIQEHKKQVPVCIMRPSIILSTYKEPLEGWNESSSGPSRMSMAFLTGVFHMPYVNKKVAADIMPADYVVNAIITCAWGGYNNQEVMTINREIYQTSMNESIFDDTKNMSDIPVFNIVSSTLNVIRWGEFWQYMRMMSDSFPLKSMVWFQYMFVTNCKFFFLLYTYFLHYPSAYLMDAVCSIIGQEKSYVKIADEATKMTWIMRPFVSREFMILNHNTQKVWSMMSPEEQSTFYYDLSKLDWYAYLKTHVAGCRQYISKENLNNMVEAVSKHRKIRALNVVVSTILLFMVGRIIMFIFGISPYYN